MNYESKARSNYFLVKDREKFDEWARSRNLRVLSSKTSGPVGFMNEEGGIPNIKPTSDVFGVSEEPTPIDFDEELSKHLKKDQVAVYMEVGSEGMRYMVGYATAVHSSGKVETIGLDDIYQKAMKKFKVKYVNNCSY